VLLRLKSDSSSRLELARKTCIMHAIPVGDVQTRTTVMNRGSLERRSTSSQIENDIESRSANDT
jgi:hypothetical protein